MSPSSFPCVGWSDSSPFSKLLPTPSGWWLYSHPSEKYTTSSIGMLGQQPNIFMGKCQIDGNQLPPTSHVWLMKCYKLTSLHGFRGLNSMFSPEITQNPQLLRVELPFSYEFRWQWQHFLTWITWRSPHFHQDPWNSHFSPRSSLVVSQLSPDFPTFSQVFPRFSSGRPVGSPAFPRCAPRRDRPRPPRSASGCGRSASRRLGSEQMGDRFMVMLWLCYGY